MGSCLLKTAICCLAMGVLRREGKSPPWLMYCADVAGSILAFLIWDIRPVLGQHTSGWRMFWGVLI